MTDKPESSDSPVSGEPQSQEPAASDAAPQDSATDRVMASDVELLGQEAGQSTPAAELVEAREQAARAQAELENVRKRLRREMEQSVRYASMTLIRDLLPIIDNLNRALEAGVEDASGLHLGVKMVADQWVEILKQHGCQPILAQGQPFDPNIHEAIGTEPSEQVPRGHVLHVVQVGYQLYDRIVRPAQVFVSAGPPENAGPENAGPENAGPADTSPEHA